MAPLVRTTAGVDASATEPDFAAFYRAHVAFVWRALQRLRVQSSELEDAVHEVFLIAHRRLDTSEPLVSTHAWLYGVARGVARNMRRQNARRLRRLAEFFDVVRTFGRAGGPNPEAAVLGQQARTLVETFCSTLPAQHREVFALGEIEGLRAPEVAQALGVNINTVYTRMRAARQRFDVFLDKQRTGVRIAHD